MTVVQRPNVIERPRIIQRSMTPTVSLRHALSDPALLGNVLRGKSWRPWRTLLIASMGEALTPDERIIFKQFTGRDHEPGRRVEEFVVVKGRRSGGSRAISVVAAYEAALVQHTALVPGERGIVLIISPDTEQSSICLDYTTAIFEQSPILSQLIAARTRTELRLTNNISVESRAADFRRLRGPSFVKVICDESAFWMTGEASANPDTEIINSVRPGLATTGGSLTMISSPYARRGSLWDVYHRHFGPEGDPSILVAQGASRSFNSTLPQRVVDRAYERDPASARAEYGALFRTDIEAFVSLERVRLHLARCSRTRTDARR
jgi:hypothetical protein